MAKLTDRQKAAIRAAIRAKSDPVGLYKPSQGQAACMESTALYRAITGINQGGKTLHGCVEMVHCLRGTHPTRHIEPGSVGVCAVPTRTQAANTQGRYLLKECGLQGPGIPKALAKVPLLDPDEVEVTWDMSARPKCPKVITHKKTGTSIQFIWTDAAKADVRLQGMKFDFAFIDETAGSQSLLDELYPRLLVANGWILWTVTQTKVNMAMEEYLKKCRDPQMPDYELFVLTPDSNPAVDKEVRDRMAKNLSDGAAAIRMHGTASALGQVLIYPQIMQNEGAYVLKEPYQIGHDDNLWLGYDPGVSHPTGQLLAAVNRHEPRRLHLVWFFCQSGWSISAEVEALRNALCGRKLTGVAYDVCGSHKTEKGSGKRIIDQVAERMTDKSWWHTGDPIWIAPKPSHNAGIAQVREYLEPAQDNYPVPLITIDPPTPENGLGVFVSQLAHYRGREDLEFTGPAGVVKKNDEGPDCLRYLCMSFIEWQNHGPNPASGVAPLPVAGMPVQPKSVIKTPEQLHREQLLQRSAEMVRRRKLKAKARKAARR